MLTILQTLAQASSSYGSDFSGSSTATTSAGSAAEAGVMLVVLFIIIMLMIIPVVIVNWKLFVKAGRPGWAALIPIYNTYIANDIAGTPVWYVVLTLLPTVGFVGQILIYIELAKKYSKPVTVWMSLLIPIVALFMIGKTDYIGDDSVQEPVAQPGQGFNIPPTTGQFQENPVTPTSSVPSASQHEVVNHDITNQPPTPPTV